MLTRKEMLKRLAAIPFLGGLTGAGILRDAPPPSFARMPIRRDYFRELGLRTFINGRGTITTLSGSLMEPEVLDAINYASGHFVGLTELNRTVGQRIAELLKCEDAHVTAGAASAITLATAATMTGTDPEKVRALPNLPGAQREVVAQRTHRIYEQQFLLCGVKFVEIEGAPEMERAINENTVMAFFFNDAGHQPISREEFVRIARDRGVPTFLDAAADVPPVDNLFKYIEMGFDLVTVSGGKGIRGPQSTGLLFGRRALIEAARMNHSPAASIGRGMKVNKEEILGMMVALETYLAKDHDAEWRKWEGWVEQIAASARAVPTVVTEMYVPPVANHVPHLRITWDAERVGITPEELRTKLRDGHPSIETSGESDSLELNVFMMQPEEVRIVGVRIREHLEEAAAS
jgi:uncharacterized pyridoxal phosphate-dependent enzyme